MKKFLKYLKWLEQEKIKISIYCNTPTNLF